MIFQTDQRLSKGDAETQQGGKESRQLSCFGHNVRRGGTVTRDGLSSHREDEAQPRAHRMSVFLKREASEIEVGATQYRYGIMLSCHCVMFGDCLQQGDCRDQDAGFCAGFRAAVNDSIAGTILSRLLVHRVRKITSSCYCSCKRVCSLRAWPP